MVLSKSAEVKNCHHQVVLANHQHHFHMEIIVHCLEVTLDVSVNEIMKLMLNYYYSVNCSSLGIRKLYEACMLMQLFLFMHHGGEEDIELGACMCLYNAIIML